MRLILASQSPRRAELLRNAGFDFEVKPSGVEEDAPGAHEPPEDFARRTAQRKALAVAAACPAGTLVLGADTVVVASNQVLGKPLGRFDAARMLRTLSNTTHRVITGVCLVRAPEAIEVLEHETTSVTFRPLDDEEIAAYIDTKEPFDKAGAYAVQGLASRFVARISGCYFNVVGLPIPLVYEILKPFLKK